MANERIDTFDVPGTVSTKAFSLLPHSTAMYSLRIIRKNLTGIIESDEIVLLSIALSGKVERIFALFDNQNQWEACFSDVLCILLSREADLDRVIQYAIDSMYAIRRASTDTVN